MKTHWPSVVLLLTAFATTLAVGALTQEDNKAFYQAREEAAPEAVKAKLESLREQVSERQLTFDVGYTTAMEYEVEQITGLVEPPDLQNQIALQNQRVAGVQRAPMMAEVAGVCSDSASSFDWRPHGGVTGVRNQGACGSCWAFATHAPFEGSYRLRHGKAIDTAEQDTLDCNPWNYGCGGGWWAFDYLINKGVGKESDYRYTATQGPCRTVSRPFQAEAWGYVGSTATPSVNEIKKALCEHGPLAVAVNVTSAFQAYGGGTFNACSEAWAPSKAYVVGDLVESSADQMYQCTTAGTSGTSQPSWSGATVNDGTVVWRSVGKINHGVTLIGWDDTRQAWLIKNSWGTGWGETGGSGSERGYMWIRYDCNNVGYGAAWVQAGEEGCTGCGC
jgi:cathepsin L